MVGDFNSLGHCVRLFLYSFLVVDQHGCFGVCAILTFWVIQFAGVSQMEQNKVMFERLSYEIDSRQILMKINPKQGMPIKWDMIKRAKINKEDFTLVMSKAQFIHLPFRIFNTENERKFVETILRRKGFISQPLPESGKK